MTAIPEHLKIWLETYSNLTGVHPGDEAEKAVKDGTHYVAHTAWDHWGAIWFENGKFIEETHVHRLVVGTYEGDTMQSVFEQANHEHGQS